MQKKSNVLTGREIRSIRHFFQMTAREFAEALGISHVAILHWESEERKMNADTEIHMRLYLLDHLEVTDKEFRKTYNQLDRKNIAHRRISSLPLEIDAEKIAC